MDDLIQNVIEWHHQKDIVDGSTEVYQALKLNEETGEMAGHVLKGKDIKDDIGDCMVVLINLAERRGYTLQECLQHAYDEISGRKGQTINGTFIKDE